MEFRRQPLPTVVTITDGEQIDREEMASLLHRYLTNQIDLVERSGTQDTQVIRCYPRAVND